MVDTASEVKVCHNDRCAQEYKPRRWDQKHCTMTCAHYCLPCLRPKYGEKNKRAREQRQGVPPVRASARPKSGQPPTDTENSETGRYGAPRGQEIDSCTSPEEKILRLL